MQNRTHRIHRLLVAFPFLVIPVVGQQQPVTKSDAAAPAGFNPISNNDVLSFFNARPAPPNAYRVLFIGDSLTFHSPAPKLWTYYSGMAASDAAHDFVHLAASRMQTRMGQRAVEIFYDQGGGKIGPMLAYAQAHPELRPDLIVLQGGENDAFNDAFQEAYRGLLDVFPGVPRIVLSDWSNTMKRDFEKKAVQDRKYPFVDLTLIKAEPGTTGNGGPFNHPGVAWHPNDAGMKRIAEEIDRTFDAKILRWVKRAR